MIEYFSQHWDLIVPTAICGCMAMSIAFVLVVAPLMNSSNISRREDYPGDFE